MKKTVILPLLLFVMLLFSACKNDDLLDGSEGIRVALSEDCEMYQPKVYNVYNVSRTSRLYSLNTDMGKTVTRTFLEDGLRLTYIYENNDGEVKNIYFIPYDNILEYSFLYSNNVYTASDEEGYILVITLTGGK